MQYQASGLKLDYTFRYIRDKSLDGEFFLKVETANATALAQGHQSWLIPCQDIEGFEPIHGCQFELRYLKAQSYFSLKKTLKVEVYESKHLAEIMDSFDTVHSMLEEQQHKLAEIASKQS